jgi:phosphopantothenoylcysteine decarboxylase / phosphopantothenate---cysteine ligase
MTGPRILLIVGGGIAAYKACELVRLIRKGVNGMPGEVTCVLTEGGAKFVTPLALAALSENPVHTTLWDLKDEVEMGHIQLSRAADLVVVCPATANLLAKMAAGIADDLATTLLLATDKPVLAVPAMNVKMWQHPATVFNVEVLRAAGVDVMDPDEGAMACGEFGPGRLPEPNAVWRRIARLLDFDPGEDELDLLADYGDDGDSVDVGHPGLGGLSASLILRSKERVDPLIEPTFDEGFAGPLPVGEEEEALPEDIAEPEFAVDEVLPEEVAPDEMPPALPGGPVMAKKGKARAAPPTDPDAINHLVSGHEDAKPPEPFAEDLPADAAGSPDLNAEPAQAEPEPDPLADQPDFAAEPEHRPLFGKHIIVTAGPTHEPIDPVRYIANRSSGKQGYAIAAVAAEMGARVTLVSGPVMLPTPPGVDRVDIETAREMAAAVKKALPADAAVMVAAVADWRTREFAEEKIKKRGSAPPALMLTENPDILATVASGKQRPKLLIGFAAETEDVIANAKDKRKRKGVDWIVANDVSGEVMGGDLNLVHIVSSKGVDTLPEMPKEEVARMLVARIADALA